MDPRSGRSEWIGDHLGHREGGAVMMRLRWQCTRLTFAGLTFAVSILVHTMTNCFDTQDATEGVRRAGRRSVCSEPLAELRKRVSCALGDFAT